jgi:hypothetical protein
LVEEDAVQVFFLYEADSPTSHNTRIVFSKFGLRETKTPGQRRNLLFASANRTGKSATATSALQALKAQAVFVPEIVSHKIGLSGYKKIRERTIH